MGDQLQELLKKLFLSGGGGDVRNVAMALPFARQAMATPALAPHLLNTPERIKEIAQQRYDDKIEKMYRAASDWYKQSNIPQMPKKDLKEWLRQQAPMKTPPMPGNQPVGTSHLGYAQGLGAGMGTAAHEPRPRQMVEPQSLLEVDDIPTPTTRGGGLSGLLPGLSQAIRSGTFDAPAQQAKSGFDEFLSSSPQLAEYFLDL